MHFKIILCAKAIYRKHTAYCLHKNQLLQHLTASDFSLKHRGLMEPRLKGLVCPLSSPWPVVEATSDHQVMGNTVGLYKRGRLFCWQFLRHCSPPSPAATGSPLVLSGPFDDFRGHQVIIFFVVVFFKRYVKDIEVDC